MTGIKQSNFTQVTTVDESDNVPLFTASENKRITYANMRDQLTDEIAVRFIYPTTAQLQQSNLEADEDEPNYVRCEETEYRLYKITALAAGVDDIALDNGMTATYQEEYSKSGFVLGAASSTNNALALFDGVTGTQLKAGAVLSTIGGNLASATSIAQVSYPRVDASNAVTMATPTTLKTDLNLPSNTAASISNIESDISTIEGDIVDINADLATKVQTVETFAALATTPATTAGMVVYLKQHTSGGIGGGNFVSYAATHSATDGGRNINSATAGIRWRRQSSVWTLEDFGARKGDGIDNTAAIRAAIAAAPWSGEAYNSGAAIYLEEGVYEHDPIVVNRPITFIGHGRYASIFVKRSPGIGFKFELDTSATGGAEDVGFVRKTDFTDIAGGHGVQFDSGRNFAKNIYSARHGGIGILISDANSCVFIGLSAFLNGSHGVAVIGKPAPDNNANALTILNIDSLVNGGSGVYFDGCFANNVIGAASQGNGRYAIEFGGVNQFIMVTGVYSEINTLGAGRINETSVGCTIQYNIVSDANPTDVGTDNSMLIESNKSFGYSRISNVKTERLDLGQPGTGAPGYLSSYDTGSQYRTSLLGTAGNAIYEIGSEGGGTLTTKLQALHNEQTALTLQNSWVNSGGGFGSANVYKSPDSCVYFSGVISGGVTTPGTVIAQLPSGHYPPSIRRLATANSGGVVILSVSGGGALSIVTGTNSDITLDGLSFKV